MSRNLVCAEIIWSLNFDDLSLFIPEIASYLAHHSVRLTIKFSEWEGGEESADGNPENGGGTLLYSVDIYHTARRPSAARASAAHLPRPNQQCR
jgi:hypothetical protein